MNRDWVEMKTHPWSMPSRPKFPLEEEEVRAEGITEENLEAEAKTEDEEIALQILKEGAVIKIRTKAKAAANKVDKNMLMDKGMTNPMSSVIIVKNMGIMQMNVGRSRMIWVIDPVQISLEKISAKINCF